jgi:hypothetical protein
VTRFGASFLDLSRASLASLLGSLDKKGVVSLSIFSALLIPRALEGLGLALVLEAL